ncbi:NF038130 family PEP-CTERM protein [Mastigocoleus sp. MO_188.B34]|uniref:NF038130 family PEP-CTERM protein n=1 Tax=Mastigocoleus sp. MO_188.B34 TaxID=3036635 RepID=UPI00262D25E8|nr:NF038130 family PEP-CTERM protein [Mastigocoleus sp. MO_188.B34]MDJ0693137.1 NF038130 family PEP-CTERM protein [Mastigocoleus sp. MO_188.B34]
MKSAVKKMLLATSIAAGMGGMFTAPALAGSLTNATIGGSAANDYYVYDSDATNTFTTDKTPENLQKVLGGNATDPTGNVELRASSEKAEFNVNEWRKNTTLEGKIGGQDIKLSSITIDDWVSRDASGMIFAQRWFNDALQANGFGILLDSMFRDQYSQALNMFADQGGFQRFSDPNISYVNQDDSTGLIRIGLAGHFDATDFLLAGLGEDERNMVNRFRSTNAPIQASEIVKVSYRGVTDYLYSFNASKSGLTEKFDGRSHNGNYEVTLAGVPPTSVPEPSVMLGLVTVAGMVVSQRKTKKA